jgi:hypothetical protein
LVATALSLAKIALKMPLADRNRSLVGSTSRCGEGITYMPIYTLNSVVSRMWQPIVHMIIRSFVVLTWMRDAIELVACAIMK